MSKPEEMTHDLSDRLLLLLNTFRKAREGYLEFNHQRSKTFQSLLNESYEDALLLEAALSGYGTPARIVNPAGKVIQFPVLKRVEPSDPSDGTA